MSFMIRVGPVEVVSDLIIAVFNVAVTLVVVIHVAGITM